MLSVYKYPIVPNDKVEILMPKGARVLTCQSQFDKPQLWALVDGNTSISLEKRIFRMVGTGHPIKESEESLHYIDTFQMANGNLIFHLFEIIE